VNGEVISGRGLSPPFTLRRVHGESMLPQLPAGKIVITHKLFRSLKPGDIVIVRHNGLEKIKRVAAINGQKLYIRGDNPAQSTDSRHFGWLDAQTVVGKVLI